MRFLLFFLSILTPTFLYLGWRLADHWWYWPILSIIFLSMLVFPLRRWGNYFLYFIFASMGFTTYLMVFSLLRDLIFLITKNLYPSYFVFSFALIAVVVGFLNAITPRVKRVKVPLKNAPPELHGLKIVQISDLHIGSTIRRPYIEKVVRKMNDLDPDIVTLTGDIGDSIVRDYRDDVAALGKIKSRHGTFYVPGNHEYYWNANEWLIVMNNLGMINLVNRGKVIDFKGKSVLVAGVPDPVSRLTPELAGMLKPETSKNADYKILLSHRPGLAHAADEAGYHLQLSGHTHGGQFFPWTIVVKMVHKMSRGLHQVNDLWLYVNQGTGSWGPLIRLGTYPEITLLELVEAQNNRLINE